MSKTTILKRLEDLEERRRQLLSTPDALSQALRAMDYDTCRARWATGDLSDLSDAENPNREGETMNEHP